MVAARVTLRLLPAVTPLLAMQPLDRSEMIVLQCFRAAAMSSFLGTWPEIEASKMKAEASDVLLWMGRAAGHAETMGSTTRGAAPGAKVVSVAAWCSVTRAKPGVFATAVDGANGLFQIASVWPSVTHDVNLIEEGLKAAQLARRSLWGDGEPEGQPGTEHQRWTTLKAMLLQLGDHWKAWTDWYDGRLIGADSLKGRRVLTELERDRLASLSRQDWATGPAHVNAKLLALETKYREGG